MATSCISVCSGIFLTVSLVLYLSQMVLNGMFVYNVVYDEELKHWFALLIGLLLLPMVTVQIVSAILLLMTNGANLTVWRSVRIASLHILQLGLVWRHVSLFRKDVTKSLTDLCLLQIIHTFTSMLPLLVIQCYILLTYNVSDWLTVSTIGVTLAGSCLFLASFRRSDQDNDLESIVLTWPGTIFRFLWRSGEIISRTISLVVFASVYYYWIFLIIGLHGVTMLVCLCTSVLGMFDKPESNKAYHVGVSVLIAYVYSFCFINFSSKNSTFRYTLYYIIMFFENLVLTIVWYLHADQSIDNGTKVNSIVFISASAFCIGVISLVIYYKFFHISASIDHDHACDVNRCINCRLSLCSKHSSKLQRPFSAGWISQYQQALVHGNYYRNILHDSLLDSEWESVSACLNSSGEHWQIRDTDLDTTVEVDHKPYTSVQAKGTYAHKRFFDSDTDLTGASDSDATSVGSGLYCEDWRKRSASVLSTLSDLGAMSITSSNRHLLTDSWDELINDVTDSSQNVRKVDVLNSLIRKDTGRAVSSDGYKSDHTLHSYQLPVTVLAKKPTMINRRGDDIERTYSTSSDSTDCTICAFMKQNPATPVQGRRQFKVQEKIPEESQKDVLLQLQNFDTDNSSVQKVKRSSKLKSKIDAHHRRKKEKRRTNDSDKSYEINAIDMSQLLDPGQNLIYKQVTCENVHIRHKSTSQTVPEICITSASTDDLPQLYVHTSVNKPKSRTSPHKVRKTKVNVNQNRDLEQIVNTCTITKSDVDPGHVVYAKPHVRKEHVVETHSPDESERIVHTNTKPHVHPFATVNTNVKSKVQTGYIRNESRIPNVQLKHTEIPNVKRDHQLGPAIVSTGKPNDRTGWAVNDSFTCRSDSGDSAFPRHTPLGSYRDEDDNDDDGKSDSSLEMII